MTLVLIVFGFWYLASLAYKTPKPKKARKTKEEIKYRRKPCFPNDKQYPVENWEVS